MNNFQIFKEYHKKLKWTDNYAPNDCTLANNQFVISINSEDSQTTLSWNVCKSVSPKVVVVVVIIIIIIIGAIHPTVERYLLYKRKISELWQVHNLDLHVEIYLTNQSFYLFHANTYFHLMNFTVNNVESTKWKKEHNFK